MTLLHNQKKLVKRLKASDVKTFKKLYDHYFPKLYKFILSQTCHREFTEDLLQEVFCRIWEKREQVIPDKSFQAFVYRIAQHLIIDHYRKSKSKKSHLVTLSFQDLVQDPEPIELDQTIQYAINKLLFKAQISQQEISPHGSEILGIVQLQQNSTPDINTLILIHSQ